MEDREIITLAPRIVDREGASVQNNFDQNNYAGLQSPSPTLRRPPRYKRGDNLPFERDKLLASLYSDNFIEVLESLQRLLYSLDESSDDSASDSGNETGSTKSSGSNDDCEICINTDFSENNEKGLSDILQCLLHLIESTKKPDIIRAKSIAAVSVLYQLDSNLSDSTYTSFLSSLLSWGQSLSHSYVILREICRAFYHCLIYKPHIIRNFYQEVCNLMVDLVTDKYHHGHELTKPATEFWRVLTESMYPIEDRHLIYLVPTLYENTQLPNKYDAKLVDLTIQCILSKFELYEDHLGTLPLELREKIFAQQRHDTLYFRLAEDEHWSLRRRSVATLAGLATRYTIKVVNLLFPFLKKHLVAHNGYHYSWQERECVCFVIGAIGGCSLELTSKLPHTLEFLVHQYYEKPPKLQSTALWAIGRHTISILQTPKMVPHIIQTIVKAVQDENKMVAHSAILTLSSLCEDAHEVVMPYASEVIGTLSNVVRYYEYTSFMKHTLYYSLMDCISVAVKNLSIGTQLPSDSSVMLGESLWMRLCEFMKSNEEKMTLSTLDCFGTLLAADSKAFRGFNNRLFSICKELLSYYTAEKEWAMFKSEERLNTVIYVLDTMADSCIMDINSCGPFFDMYLPIWVLHPNMAVKQNIFALIGDLAKNEYLRDFNVTPLLPIFAQNLICDASTPTTKIMVISNVAWALGELIVRKYREMSNYITEFANALIAILAIEDMTTNGFLGLIENSAITLGRFGLVCSHILAHKIEDFLGNWCNAMRNVRDSFPKEQAFIGICNIIDENLDSIQASKYEAICDAFLSWNVTSSELNGRFVKILDHFKGKNEWSAQVGRFPQPLVALLSQKYGI